MYGGRQRRGRRTDVATQLEKLEGMLQRGTLTGGRVRGPEAQAARLTAVATAPRVVSLVPSATETLLAHRRRRRRVHPVLRAARPAPRGRHQEPRRRRDRRPRPRPRRGRRGGEPARGRRRAGGRRARVARARRAVGRWRAGGGRRAGAAVRSAGATPDRAAAGAGGGAGVRADLAATVDDDQRGDVRGIAAAGRRHRARDRRVAGHTTRRSSWRTSPRWRPTWCSSRASRTRSPTAHLDELRAAFPGVGRRARRRRRTCSGGAPARRAPSSASDRQRQRLAELLQGVDVERRPQGQVHLVGAGLDVLTDAVDDLAPPNRRARPGGLLRRVAPNCGEEALLGPGEADVDGTADLGPGRGRRRRSGGAAPRAWRRTSADRRTGRSTPSAYWAAIRSVRFSPPPPTQIGSLACTGRGSLRASCGREPRPLERRGLVVEQAAEDGDALLELVHAGADRREVDAVGAGTRPRPSRRRCPSRRGRRRSGRSP